jgi:hypothetical protein
MENNEKGLLERLKIVLGFVETELSTEESVEESVETVVSVEESIETVESIEEVVEAALTPEEQTAIVAEVMQILEPRLAAIEEAMLLMGKTYKDENEELKTQLTKLSAEPAVEPLRTRITLPEAENALTNVLNKRKNK